MATIGHCKVDHLIVDSGALIRNIEIKDIGKKIYSIREVVSEIRDKATRQRLQVLPYDITFKEPTPEAYHAVAEFSKKTGDFVSLSAVDLRILALAYQLEKENVGTEHIRHEPVRKAEVWQTKRNFENPAQIAGFYLGPKETSSQKSSKSETSSVTGLESGQSEGDNGEDNKDTMVDDSKPGVEPSSQEDEFHKVEENDDENEGKDVAENKLEKSEDEDKDNEIKDNEADDNNENKDDENDEKKSDANNQENKTEGCDKEKTQNDLQSHDDSHGDVQDDCDDAEEEEDDDDGGWVTPDNIAAVLMQSNLLDVKPVQVVPVACLTTDFAMQNVLLQMGLNVLSANGMLIKRAKSYVLRCYGCFKVITDMTRVVCPKCGYNTLRKVSMTVNDDGSVQYYLSNRKPTKTRALQHPRPMPKEGKHAHHQQHKHSQGKYDVYNLDNITLDSPFAINDFNRRSTTNHVKGQNRSRRK